jgi:hypothetical protein
MTRYDPFSGREYRATLLQLTIGIQHAMFELFAAALLIGGSFYFVAYSPYVPGVAAFIALLYCGKHTRRLTKLSDRLNEDQAKLDADDEYPDD